MIGVSGFAPGSLLDREFTTDGATVAYTFPLTGYADGSIIMLAISFTTGTIKQASYLLCIHRQTNIGATVNTLSKREWDSFAITFSATDTAVTMTLNTALVGTLKIAPVLMNV